ncbi:MAG: SDR family oxidoreductase, partial [Aeromonas veronii]
KLFVRLNALLPGIVDKALARQLPIIKRYARHLQPETTDVGANSAQQPDLSRQIPTRKEH